MDDRYRDALQRHYRLLMTHISLTDDVIQQMAKEKILPETMIKDIQTAESRDERNERLLNSLRLRGNKCFKRFRELMYRTGNFFVADLLWEEGDGLALLDEKELAMIPGLMNCVSDHHKKKLLRYLDSKVREKALQLSWKETPSDRMEALQNKVVDFNQERSHRETIAAQEEKIKTLELTLQSEREVSQNLHLELSGLQQQIIILKREHRSHMDTQNRFHDANMSTIVRLKDRINKVNKALLDLNEVVRNRVELVGDDSGDAGNDGEDEEQKLVVLERNIRRILVQLKKEKEEISTCHAQREEVLRLLNRRYSKDPLASVIKEVLKHEQKHRSIVMREILKLSEALKQMVPSTSQPTSAMAAVNLATLPIDPATLDTKHFKSQLAMMKAQVEHIQKRFIWKDSELDALKQELQQLKIKSQGYDGGGGNCSVASGGGSSSGRLSSSGTSLPTSISFTLSPRSQDSQEPASLAPSSHTSILISPPSRTSPLITVTSPRGKPQARWRGSASSGKSVTFVDTVHRVVAKGRLAKIKAAVIGSASGVGDLDKMMVNADQYLEEEESERDEGVDKEDFLPLTGRSGSGEGDNNDALTPKPHASSWRSSQR